MKRRCVEINEYFRFLPACLQGRILSTVDATRVHGGNQFLASHKYLARSSGKGLCDPKSRSAPDVRRRSRSYSSLLLSLTSTAPPLLAAVSVQQQGIWFSTFDGINNFQRQGGSRCPDIFAPHSRVFCACHPSTTNIFHSFRPFRPCCWQSMMNLSPLYDEF